MQRLPGWLERLAGTSLVRQLRHSIGPSTRASHLAAGAILAVTGVSVLVRQQ